MGDNILPDALADTVGEFLLDLIGHPAKAEAFGD